MIFNDILIIFICYYPLQQLTEASHSGKKKKQFAPRPKKNQVSYQNSGQNWSPFYSKCLQKMLASSVYMAIVNLQKYMNTKKGLKLASLFTSTVQITRDILAKISDP